MYCSCAQWYAHKYKQFVSFCVKKTIRLATVAKVSVNNRNKIMLNGLIRKLDKTGSAD